MEGNSFRTPVTLVIGLRGEASCMISRIKTNLAVHVVLCLDQLAPVDLSGVGLAGHNVALCLMQHFDWYSDRHVSTVFLRERKSIYGRKRSQCVVAR